MHEKLFSIQIFQYFRQIPPRVCTLVLFIIQAVKIIILLLMFIVCQVARTLVAGSDLPWGILYYVALIVD